MRPGNGACTATKSDVAGHWRHACGVATGSKAHPTNQACAGACRSIVSKGSHTLGASGPGSLASAADSNACPLQPPTGGNGSLTSVLTAIECLTALSRRSGGIDGPKDQFACQRV